MDLFTDRFMSEADRLVKGAVDANSAVQREVRMIALTVELLARLAVSDYLNDGQREQAEQLTASCRSIEFR